MKGFDRGRSQQAYGSARSTLLILVILTVVNVVFWFASVGVEMLFCIDFPYIIIVFMDAMGNAPLGIAIGAAVLLFFLAAWYMSAKNHVWLIAAAAAHGLDTFTLVWLAANNDFGEFVFPLVIHVVASVYLVVGCVHGAKLKKAGPAQPDPAFAARPGAWQAGQAGQYQSFGPQDVYQQGVQPQQGQYFQSQPGAQPQQGQYAQPYQEQSADQPQQDPYQPAQPQQQDGQAPDAGASDPRGE